MKQKQFETMHSKCWSDVEAVLADKSNQAGRLPALHRRLCHSLALALQRGYSPALTDYLHRLVLQSHSRLYGAAAERPLLLRQWLLRDLPRGVRAEWRLALLAITAFWGAALVTGLLTWYAPQWAYSFMSPLELAKLQEMYSSPALATGRGDSGDLMMFGFYIWNNVSIDFRTFAGGLLGGVPAILSLLLNGMHLGVAGSWLSRDDVTREAFWSFVITHSSFEITGLLLAAIAGMRLGFTLIHPGRLLRRDALRAAAARMFPILIGATLLTVIAAFFEGFWSASPSIPVSVKYAVGTACWIAVTAYFVFVGKSRR